MKRYFLTVDWCNLGNRGVFCDNQGKAFPKDTKHTEDDFWEMLDAFCFVLSPQSDEFTEDELKEYKNWIPLSEFSNHYGVALKARSK